MNITIDGLAALRLIRAVRAQRIEDLGPEVLSLRTGLSAPVFAEGKRWSAKRLSAALTRFGDLCPFPTKRPLDIAVPTKDKRLRISGIKSRVYGHPLPKNAFVDLGCGVSAAGPELLFVEMGAFMQPAVQLMLGLELCGRFSRDPMDPRDGEVSFNIEPATTPEAILSRPHQARLHGPGAYRQALRGHHLPAHGRGLACSRQKPLIGGSITCLRTGEGWLYLATVIDLATRTVVSWSMSERMTADIVAAALGNAKGRGYVAKNAVFHSDRGSQYTSRMLLDWAEENNVRLSCSRTGNCHDNAVAGSFFATLKNEMYYRRSFKTRADARRAVFNYIEVFHNRRRPHSTMGYQVPGELMDTFFARTAPGWGKLPIAA